MNTADESRVIPLGIDPPAEPRSTSPIALIVVVVVLAIGLTAAVVTTAAPVPTVEWTEGVAPQVRLNAQSLVATPTGFSVLGGLRGSGGTVWSTTDGSNWNWRTLPNLSQRIVYHSRGLFVIDRGSLTRVGPDGDDPIGRIDLPEPIRVGRGSGRAGLFAGLEGLLAQTVGGDLFWSPDGREFEFVMEAREWGADSDVTPRPSDVVDVAAGRVRSDCGPRAQIAPDVPPVVTTSTGLIAFVPEHDPSVTWPVCEPVLWRSTDGTDWAPVSDESPFPATAYVYDVASHDDRLIAVGGIGYDRSRVWTSDDGGVWSQIQSIQAPADADVTQVEAGPAGWVIVAIPRDGSSPLGWYSADGDCWEEVPAGVAGSGIAVGDDLVLFVEADPARVAVGTPTGASWIRDCA